MPTLHPMLDSILITGAGGMLAKALQLKLAARGVASTCLARAELDVTDESSLRAAIAVCRPRVILNCAAYTKVDLAETETDRADAINGRAVGLLARLAGEFDATLVHFSTDYVFDGTIDRPLRPTDTVGPRSAYGRSKLLGEMLLQQNAPARWLILRTAWLYGPGGPNFAATMIKAARAGKPLKVVADQHGSPTFTHDLADATLDLLERGAESGIYHATNGGRTTWFDFTRAILDEFELATELSPTTTAEWFKIKPDSAVRPSFSVLDLTKTETAMGRPMRPWRVALKAYREAVKSAGGVV
jgi:dTDP-4-dehydrorhamnose reductase